MNTLTLSQLHQALSIAENIEKLKASLASILSGSSTTPKAASGKRRLSASAKKALWAKRMNVVSPLDTLLEPERPKKRKNGAMSEEHRSKLAAAAQKRWAAIKAGKAANPFGKKKKGK